MGTEDSTEGWLMVFISSIACVLGASIVFLGRSVLESQRFLSASMALGGGVLIFNSLYTLLPASSQKFDSSLMTFICYFGGVLFTVGLTYFIQWCTPRAIHTCDPTHASKSVNIQYTVQEEVVVVDNGMNKPLLSDHHNHHHHHEQDTEYGSIVNSEEEEHHAREDYFLIGIQTAIAICIHKFPEGLIMFVSNESSSQLGLSVTVAITIHNFIEGFLIALPLFYATGSRLAAFGYASLLGGMSQPLGAVLGLLAIRNVDQVQEKFLFGIIFGVVSGMMSLIAVQSMLPQAIKADATHRCVPLFFFFGIFLVSLSELFQSI